MLSAIISHLRIGTCPGADAGCAGARRYRRPARRSDRGRAGSRDSTAKVADIAGCRLMGRASRWARGSRPRPSALARPGSCFCAPAASGAGLGRSHRTLHRGHGPARRPRAAVFRPPGIADLLRPGLSEVFALLRVTLGGGARPEQGLLIARRQRRPVSAVIPAAPTPKPRCCAGSAGGGLAMLATGGAPGGLSQ